MPEPPREPFDDVPDAETDAAGDSDEDGDGGASRTLAAAAPGESVTAERLRTRLVSAGGPARLLDVLAPGEAPQYLLEGVMADHVGADGDLRRRMARPGGNVFTLVTDRAVHLVVQYRERLAVDSVPLTTVEDTTLQHAGGETRLGIDTGAERYRVYPSETPTAETDAAAAYLDGWKAPTEGSDARETTEPVSALERLAHLYERGHLTDEEFAAAKRDLLDS